MMSRRAQEIKLDLLNALKQCSDIAFARHGFKRSPKGTTYSRQDSGVEHQICINVNYHPKGKTGAELELLPMMRLKMDAVLVQALCLSKGADNIFPPDPEFIVSQPIHFAAPKDKFIQWFARGKEEINHTVLDAFAFCEQWVIPFFDELTTPQNLIEIYVKGDERMMKQSHWYVFIAAAYVITGQPLEALKVLDQKLGSTGLRKQYATIFESVRDIVATNGNAECVPFNIEQPTAGTMPVPTEQKFGSTRDLMG